MFPRRCLAITARQSIRAYSQHKGPQSYGWTDRTRVRRILNQLFEPTDPTKLAESAAERHRAKVMARQQPQEQQLKYPGASPLDELGPISNTVADESIPNDILEHAPNATTTLFWNTHGVSFHKRDFERLLGPVQRHPALVDFELIRNRDPQTLARLPGYFLRFTGPKSAAWFFQETIGAEICGLQTRFQFVDPEKCKGISSAVLEKAPDVPRDCCSLMFGLPRNFSQTQVLNVLYDYDFVDDDRLAVEQLVQKNIRYGGGALLLRFKTPTEPRRLWREFHGQPFPYTEGQQPLIIETLD